MKKSKISLKWKLFGYILLFATSIVLLFAFFQIFLLESFYSYIKTRDINSLLSSVIQEVESETVESNTSLNDCINNNSTLSRKLLTLSQDKEGAIYIFQAKNNDAQYNLVYASAQGSAYNKFISNANITNDVVINEIWEKALIESSSNKTFYIIFTENADEKFKVMVTSNTKAQEEDSLICGKFFYQKDASYMIVVDSRLTPVGPAVDAMKTQILYISLIIVILTIIVAMLMSKTISKPIITINHTAKKMAEGDYNVEFTGHGYSEITDLNDTLNYTVSELKKTETLQRELLANISHDLRTPLTLISGYAEMMRDLPNEKTEENATIIIDEANRLSLLVNDLLSLSRIKARTEPLNITCFNISELLVNIIDRQNKLLESSNMVINLDIPCDVYVNADIVKIEQVIYNFLNNAINYSGDAHVVDVIEEVAEDQVTIKVKDYGIGIKKEDLDSIWQRYYRVDKGLKRSNEGSGLGLSIIKEILDYHGFSYGVTSTVGKGSIFYFCIPIVKK